MSLKFLILLIVGLSLISSLTGKGESKLAKVLMKLMILCAAAMLIVYAASFFFAFSFVALYFLMGLTAVIIVIKLIVKILF